MTPAEHIAELRQWHAMIATSMSGFTSAFEPATYARWRDVGVLLMELERLRGEVSGADTRAMPVPGGPCEAYYIKGWNDALRVASPVARTTLVKARLAGRDLLTAEAMVCEALTSCRRAVVRPDSRPEARPDAWEGSR